MVRMSMFTALLVLVMTLQHGEASAAAAIAVNSSTGAWGEAHNYPSPGSAMREALRKCGPGCTVPKTFWNTCMSFAVGTAPGKRFSSWSIRPNGEQATGAAILECHRAGGNECQSLVTRCDG